MYSATTSANKPTESTGSTAECYENIYPSSREQRHDERYDGRGTFRDHPDALPDRTVELTTQAEHYGDHSNGVLELWNCD